MEHTLQFQLELQTLFGFDLKEAFCFPLLKYGSLFRFRTAAGRFIISGQRSLSKPQKWKITDTYLAPIFYLYLQKMTKKPTAEKTGQGCTNHIDKLVCNWQLLCHIYSFLFNMLILFKNTNKKVAQKVEIHALSLKKNYAGSWFLQHRLFISVVRINSCFTRHIANILN